MKHRRLAESLVDNGIRHFVHVPGFPATLLIKALEEMDVWIRDAANERTAAELAFGMSVAGVAVGIIVKGSGAFLTAEPLQNAVVHATGAPLLLIAADDVLAASSTSPTDSRWFGPIIHSPVFDLPGGAWGADVVAEAMEASESCRRPVILRFNGSTVTASAAIEGHGAVASEFVPADTSNAHKTTKLARYLDVVVSRAEELTEVADSSRCQLVPANSDSGVLAVGSAWDLVASESRDGKYPILGISSVHPLPAAVVEFCRGLKRVLVLEHGEPFVEDQAQLLLARSGVTCEVLGQRSGHCPPLGTVNPADLRSILENPDTLPWAFPDPDRGEPEQDPRYEPLFAALAQLRSRLGVSVHSCVGSCISAAYPPYEVADTALALGASIAVAAGATVGTGRTSVALIGDYGLIHSGLGAHDWVYQQDLPVVTVVLADGASTKTGGQPTAINSGRYGTRALDIRRLLNRSAPDEKLFVLRSDEADAQMLEEVIAGAIGMAPATVILLSSDSVAYA